MPFDLPIRDDARADDPGAVARPPRPDA